MMIDWIAFYEDAIKKDWKISTILSKIEEALIDIEGIEYSTTVKNKLKLYIGENYDNT